uniref:polysaccharide (de)acetylase n=1 Tax=Flavobacterium sp. TaxID=239 RepID=UPI00404B55D9
MNQVYKRLKDNLANIYGWRTDRKIVVIESDDWGSVRVQSKEAYERLNQKYNIGQVSYNRFDALETSDDIEELFETLSKFVDINGNHPKITTNFNVTNPDFDKIRDANFKSYFFETFKESYTKYYQSSRNFDLIKQGIGSNLILPQFHGREHVQVEYWMRDLQSNREETRDGFDNSFFGFGKNYLDNEGYLSAFNAMYFSDLESVKKRIQDGMQIFETLFGYKSRSIIAPQNTMHHSLLPFLKTLEIDVIQGARVNKQTVLKSGEKPTYRRFMGLTNSTGQLDIIRNITFEPSSGKINWVEKSLKEIEIAFFWKKPAVICSHRVNFMGFLDKKNREFGLNQLELLLTNIKQKWPNVEFMTTLELADAIKLRK